MSNLVFSSQKFLQWKRRVEKNGVIITNIEVLGTISRDHINLFSAFLDCKLLTPEGIEINRYVVIGGESVVVIPVFKCLEDKEIYTFMVEQRRVVDGDLTLEFPAGEIDLTIDNPKIAACQELKEELGIIVSPTELISMCKKKVKINPSFSDGLVNFFYFKREVTFSYLKQLNGRSTGCNEEGEFIKIKLMKMDRVVDCMTASAFIGINLLERILNCKF